MSDLSKQDDLLITVINDEDTQPKTRTLTMGDIVYRTVFDDPQSEREDQQRQSDLKQFHAQAHAKSVVHLRVVSDNTDRNFSAFA